MSPEKRTDVRVGTRALSLSNLDKVLWPRDDYAKRDLIGFYQTVAPYSPEKASAARSAAAPTKFND